IQGHKELSRQVLEYADGLPLTIKVMGSLLCGQNESEWKDALERLKTIPLKETMKILELSYDALDDDYKEIFLDVACLLKGWEKDDAVIALESCGFHARNGLRVLEQRSLITIPGRYGELEMHDHIEEIGIKLYGSRGGLQTNILRCCVLTQRNGLRVLEQRSLITISENEYLGMHDHIEEMGKNIVRRLNPNEPKRHSRLWIREEIEEILANDWGTKATECIRQLDTY
ncbi:Toll/interleukin-1 receptor domain-containing protein, partial [Tanacetum coccineum]